MNNACILVECATIKSSGFYADKCLYEDKMVHAEIVANGKVGTLKK
jgi:hypothetical protein